jgi:hypothetical protein
VDKALREFLRNYPVVPTAFHKSKVDTLNLIPLSMMGKDYKRKTALKPVFPLVRACMCVCAHYNEILFAYIYIYIYIYCMHIYIYIYIYIYIV